jgi:hypothetical protein
MVRPQALLLFTTIAGTTAASVPSQRSEAEGYLIPEQGDGVFTASFGPDGTLVNITRHDVASVARLAQGEDAAALSGRDGDLAARAVPVSRHSCNK